ncbi:MAG TPA: hypothetical protein PLP61_11775 [Nocardioides sp.]|uniref:hypothetical protein n=1 Tax=Nocardioides sp. TaxID=35761 RepID=UPI002CF697AA|nr:hypothetical protein [Nocardioides sp.]HQR27709.1 hypothetical protein [Nocardioides sp.]
MDMSQFGKLFRRTTQEVADLTGRTEAEVDLVLGAALVALGTAAALRVLMALVNLGAEAGGRAWSG